MIDPSTSFWKERAADPASVAAFVSSGYHPVLARILAARGITPDTLNAFLDPSLKRLLRPTELPGIAAAVDVVLRFIAAKEQIVVFGDYDADGVCAAAILVRTFRRLGAVTAEAFFPDRIAEGYGMTAASVARLLREFPAVRLIVTVDNGIASVHEVASLKAHGIAVVVTDHHLPGPELPDAADACVNPRVAADSDGACSGLCGAGVAFFLSSALARAAVERGLYTSGKFSGPLLVMAGLATVADMMPLTDQNRILVTQALTSFSAVAPMGLKELLLRAARRPVGLSARDFGFLLAPRINAVGRMASARPAYELLMTEDRETARNLAVSVDGLNGCRKSEETRMAAEARNCLIAGTDAAAFVIADSDRSADAAGAPWCPGVAGIVAARLMEEFNRPVVVLVGRHGSVRAPEGYNVYDALTASAAALERFGGHAAAGGLTVKVGALASFRRLFCEACARQHANASETVSAVFDMWIHSDSLNMDLMQAVRQAEPFGEANPEPVFGLRGVSVKSAKVMGQDGRHLALEFTDPHIPRALWWGHGTDVEMLRAHAAGRFDMLFTCVESDYGTAEPHLELRLEALRPSVEGTSQTPVPAQTL